MYRVLTRQLGQTDEGSHTAMVDHRDVRLVVRNAGVSFQRWGDTSQKECMPATQPRTASIKQKIVTRNNELNFWLSELRKCEFCGKIFTLNRTSAKTTCNECRLLYESLDNDEIGTGGVMRICRDITPKTGDVFGDGRIVRKHIHEDD